MVEYRVAIGKCHGGPGLHRRHIGDELALDLLDGDGLAAPVRTCASIDAACAHRPDSAIARAAASLDIVGKLRETLASLGNGKWTILVAESRSRLSRPNRRIVCVAAANGFRLGNFTLYAESHRFKADFGGTDLGRENDVGLTYAFMDNGMARLQHARYEPGTGSPDPSVHKTWLTLTITY